MRSIGQMIVQQDDVSAGRLLQNAPGKHAGIPGERVAGAHRPGNVLQSRILEIGPQKRVTQTDRRTKKARTETTNAAHAFAAAFDLGPQTPGRKKTK